MITTCYQSALNDGIANDGIIPNHAIADDRACGAHHGCNNAERRNKDECEIPLLESPSEDTSQLEYFGGCHGRRNRPNADSTLPRSDVLLELRTKDETNADCNSCDANIY